jgi:hypothetical protein
MPEVMVQSKYYDRNRPIYSIDGVGGGSGVTLSSPIVASQKDMELINPTINLFGIDSRVNFPDGVFVFTKNSNFA